MAALRTLKVLMWRLLLKRSVSNTAGSIISHLLISRNISITLLNVHFKGLRASHQNILLIVADDIGHQFDM